MIVMKQPYDAPDTRRINIVAKSSLCQTSTGERFGIQQELNTGWEEDD